MRPGQWPRAALTLVMWGLLSGTPLSALEPPASAAVFGAAAAHAALGALPGETAAFDASAAPGRSLAPTTVCACECQGRFDASWPEPPDSGGLGATAAGGVAGFAVGFAASHATSRHALRALRPVPWWRPAGVALGAAVLMSLPYKTPDLAAGRWRDCDLGRRRDTLNGLDRVLRRRLAGPSAGEHEELAPKLRRRAQLARVSDATVAAAAALPLGVIAGSRGTHDVRDVVVYGEVLAANYGLLMFTKRFFSRPRPYTHFCEPTAPEPLHARDAQFSFFSGHSSLSFAGAMTAARLARLRGHRNAGAIKWTGLGLASTTALLRMAGDKHYFTDVVVGAGVGLALGHFIPKWQQPRERDTLPTVQDARQAATRLDSATVPTSSELPTPESALFSVRLRGRSAAHAGHPHGTWLAGGLIGGGPALALHLRF